MDEGRRALDRGDWETARAVFRSAVAADGSPDAYDGLGQALWCLGDVAGGIAARERAFDGYARARRCEEAARLAVWVSHQHALAGRASAARGWLARSERALEGHGECAGHGWVAVERARHCTSVEEQIELATHAIEIARGAQVGDLELFALSVLGRAEIDAGRQEAGMALLEEAMATATAGEVRDLHTLGEAYCNMITASTDAGDWERATEWCGVVDGFAEQTGLTPLFGACRSVHADVLLATGHWPEAERALETALETHASSIPAMAAPAIASLAELRIRQNRLADAEQLLAGREEHPASLRALALLRVAEGRPQVASGLLERNLHDAEDNAVRLAQLLAPLVDARIACGDAAGAAEASEQLAELAESTGLRLIAARAELAAARVALAREPADTAQAAETAHRALAAFSSLSMPAAAAEARVELARALAPESPEVASDEARAAHRALRELGDLRGADRAAAVVRERGGALGARERVHGDLTAREREVLDLITRGMSNAQIAHALVISEKTAGHHVSRILMKLGVRNRTEAATMATRGV
jgi:DNA-binding NarL/FixJ family response regulator